MKMVVLSNTAAHGTKQPGRTEDSAADIRCRYRHRRFRQLTYRELEVEAEVTEISGQLGYMLEATVESTKTKTPKPRSSWQWPWL
jgi:hypothetical protein